MKMLNDSYWYDELIYSSNDKEQLIEFAEENFNEHSAPYRVYITDKNGSVVFYREK